jgi:hypothetical protein
MKREDHRMGLDITAYEKLTFAREQEDEDDDGGEGGVRVYQNPDFPERADGLRKGIYRTDGETHRFRAGSYSGYSFWRGQLARGFMGLEATFMKWEVTEAHAGLPFYELVNFSDCEGFIGARTSVKLAKDFADHRDRAVKLEADGKVCVGFVELYDEWARAFQIAARGGAVHFR